ncbi:uncharacterized protein LOC132703456 [Cylas formicarius]|uniref:uncharacterized protein LOC132703456 n=1 Tax=Cylas formicarius TaxID=197179 RepID=UPI0029585477|nr:uncharacterized protein LOC132703456 [Cylas formicarius]
MDNSSGRESSVQWPKIIHDVTTPSLAEFIEDESNNVTTVVIFVVSAVLVIILIFLMAVFIDCRQQKIQDFEAQSKKKARIKVRRIVPRVLGIPRRCEDNQTIVDNMETTSSNMIV